MGLGVHWMNGANEWSEHTRAYIHICMYTHLKRCSYALQLDCINLPSAERSMWLTTLECFLKVALSFNEAVSARFRPPKLDIGLDSHVTSYMYLCVCVCGREGWERG